jgi:hypothetical protein
MLLKPQKPKPKMKVIVIMAKRDQGGVHEHFVESRYENAQEKTCVQDRNESVYGIFTGAAC